MLGREYGVNMERNEEASGTRVLVYVADFYILSPRSPFYHSSASCYLLLRGASRGSWAVPVPQGVPGNICEDGIAFTCDGEVTCSSWLYASGKHGGNNGSGGGGGDGGGGSGSGGGNGGSGGEGGEPKQLAVACLGGARTLRILRIVKPIEPFKELHGSSSSSYPMDSMGSMGMTGSMGTMGSLTNTGGGGGGGGGGGDGGGGGGKVGMGGVRGMSRDVSGGGGDMGSSVGNGAMGRDVSFRDSSFSRHRRSGANALAQMTGPVMVRALDMSPLLCMCVRMLFVYCVCGL